MNAVRTRLAKLERGTSKTWPSLLIWQNEGETEDQAHRRLVAKMRAAGWPGNPNNYPGASFVVRWLCGSDEAEAQA